MAHSFQILCLWSIVAINIRASYALTSIINPNSSVTVIKCGSTDDCYIECSLPNICEQTEIILENYDSNYNVTIKCIAEYACHHTFIHGITTNLFFFINATNGLRASDIWLMFPTNYTDSEFRIESHAYQGVSYTDFNLFSEDSTKTLNPSTQPSFIQSGLIYIDDRNEESFKDCNWYLQTSKYVTLNFSEYKYSYRNNYYFPVMVADNHTFVGTVYCQPWSTNNLACAGILRIYSALGMNAIECVGAYHDCWDLYLYCGWDYGYYCEKPYSSECTNECTNNVTFYADTNAVVQFSYARNTIDLSALSYWNNQNILLYIAGLYQTNAWFDNSLYLDTVLANFVCPSNSECSIYCLSFYSCKEIELNASNSTVLGINGVTYVNEYFSMANAQIYASPQLNNIVKIGAELTSFYRVNLQFYGVNSREINIEHCEFCGNSSWFLMDSDLINFNCDPSYTSGTDLPCIYTYFFIGNASVMNLNCVSPDGCRSSKIFSDAGANGVHYSEWQTLAVSCLMSDSTSCEDLEIIYPDQSGCVYRYNATNGGWYCEAFGAPSLNPTSVPTTTPTSVPTRAPTSIPSAAPTTMPMTLYPTAVPSINPTLTPSANVLVSHPTMGPTHVQSTIAKSTTDVIVTEDDSVDQSEGYMVNVVMSVVSTLFMQMFLF